MAPETVVDPETAARQSLAIAAIVEIEASSSLILRMMEYTGDVVPEHTPLRGIALRLHALAGVALGAIDHGSGTVDEMRATLHGTAHQTIEEVPHG